MPRTPRTPRPAATSTTASTTTSTVDAIAATSPRPAAAPTADDARAAAAYLAQLTTDTGRRGAASSLRRVAAALGASTPDAVPWHALTAAHVRAMLARMLTTPTKSGTPPAPATVSLALAVTKGVIRALWEMGTIDGDQAARIRAVTPPRGDRLPAGRDVPATERNAVISAAAAVSGPHAARDAAVLAVAATTGMRIGEIVGLRMVDVTITDDAVTLRIVGKGRHERQNILRNGQRRALVEWLAVRGDAPGAVFCRITRSGTVTHAHMSTQAMHAAIQRRAAAAGIDTVTVHDLRRTVAGDMLDAGIDVVTVGRWLGHASPTTTARYDRRGARAIDAASRVLHIDYPRRRRAAVSE